MYQTNDKALHAATDPAISSRRMSYLSRRADYLLDPFWVAVYPSLRTAITMPLV